MPSGFTCVTVPVKYTLFRYIEYPSMFMSNSDRLLRSPYCNATFPFDISHVFCFHSILVYVLVSYTDVCLLSSVKLP